GRRSRRFALGGEIPDGPLAYRSEHEAVPLSEVERMLVLSAMGGTTGWHFSITRHARYAPHMSNYPAAAAGRTFPSAAGFHPTGAFLPGGLGRVPVGPPRRRRARRPGRGAGDARADGQAPPRAGTEAGRPAALPAGRGAVPGGPQHLVRQRPGVAARDPGGRH